MTVNIFKDAWAWLKKAFTQTLPKVETVAVAVTEAVQQALKNGTADFLVKFADTLFPELHGLPDTILAIIKANIQKVLVLELGLEAVQAGATPDNIAALEQAILDAFKIHDNKSKLYTEIAAQVFFDVSAWIKGPDHTFGSAITLIEQEFIQFKKLQAELQDS